MSPKSALSPLALAIIAVALLGGRAAAAPALSLESANAATTGKPIDLSVRAAADPAYAPVLARRAAGAARTSVERQFSSGAVAAFGFLCGLQPNPYSSGAAGAHGHDPQGRFVGAKLSFALK